MGGVKADDANDVGRGHVSVGKHPGPHPADDRCADGKQLFQIGARERVQRNSIVPGAEPCRVKEGCTEGSRAEEFGDLAADVGADGLLPIHPHQPPGRVRLGRERGVDPLRKRGEIRVERADNDARVELAGIMQPDKVAPI